MILWIVYFVLSGVILYQTFSILRLSDKVEELESWKDFWYREYLRVADEKEKLSEIIENVKNSMSF